MKKTISLVLVLVLCLAVEVANADFTFGEPVNMEPPINSSSEEKLSNLIISADGLEMYISSERSGGLGYFDLWRSTRENADDPWGPLVNVQEINSRYNETFPCLSGDGLTLYFSDWYYWNDAGDRPGGVGSHDLWMCTRASRNDLWGTPVNVGAPLNSGSPDMCPIISHDGLTFIFASNRSGSLGRYDLWISTRPAADGDWAEPVNMGPAVNSSAFDAEAWLSTDGLALFFFSNRPGGSGGYDIWVTTRRSQAAAWTPAVNLGLAINTSGLETIPSLSPDQKTLYFGSVQSGVSGGWECAYEAPIVPIVDLNADGIVDSADMCIMVEYWGTDNSLCDIGPMPWGDGIVDVQDLIVLAEHLFEAYRLVAHWPLDESEGIYAADSVSSNDAILIGGAVWQPDSGQIGGALQLNGVDGYAIAGAVLNPADGPFSIFAWVKGGALGQVLISQAVGANWLMADSPSGHLMTDLKESGRSAKPLVSETVITDGNWHRVGLVFDGANRILYVDDVAVAADTQSGLAGSNGSLYIGCGKDMEQGSFFSGLIDDVRIYNRAVTP